MTRSDWVLLAVCGFVVGASLGFAGWWLVDHTYPGVPPSPVHPMVPAGVEPIRFQR